MAVTPAWTQQPPSITSTVTGDIFNEAEDYYLSPTDYSNVESTLLFLLFGFPGAGGAGTIEIGAGTKLGELYFGGLLMLEHSGNSGNFAGGVGEYIDSDTDVLLDGNNQIVGRLETRSVRESYDVNLDDNVHVLIGLGANLGIFGNLSYQEIGQKGSYAPSYAFPGSAALNLATNAAATFDAVTTTHTDSAGTVTNKNSKMFGDGHDKFTSVNGEATVGLKLPLGEASLNIKGGLVFNIRDASEAGAFQQYTLTHSLFVCLRHFALFVISYY